MLPILLLGVPLADLALTIWLFLEQPNLPVFLYLLATFLLGLVVLRYAGPITLVRATARLRKGEVPGQEMLDGLFLLAAGIYFLLPGPIGDVLAIVLATPLLRRLPRWYVRKRFAKRAPLQGGPVDVDEYRVE